jgi:nucleotide-binding universal stress UspA family protein
MEVVLAVDGSPRSDMAEGMVEALRLPSRSLVTVLAVVPEPVLLGGVTVGGLGGSATIAREQQMQNATDLARSVIEKLRAVEIMASQDIRSCDPAEQILRAASEIGAELIVMGAKGQAASS